MTETMPTNFKEAMDFMISSIVELGTAVQSSVKPSWLSDTERFRSLFNQLTKAGKIESMRTKICTVFFVNNQENLSKNISSAEGKLNDSFLRYDSAASKNTLKSKTTRNGIYLSHAGIFLPISEAYEKSITVTESSGDNLPFRVKILGALYCLMYHTVKDIKDHVEFEIEPGTNFSAYVSEKEKEQLKKNMNELLESLSEYDKVKEKPSMFSSLFGMLGIDEKQVASMAQTMFKQPGIMEAMKPVMDQLSSGNMDLSKLDLGSFGSMAEEFAKTQTMNIAEEDMEEAVTSGGHEALQGGGHMENPGDQS